MIILFKFKIYWKLDLGKYQILYLTCWSRMQQVCKCVRMYRRRACMCVRARARRFTSEIPEEEKFSRSSYLNLITFCFFPSSSFHQSL